MRACRRRGVVSGAWGIIVGREHAFHQPAFHQQPFRQRLFQRPTVRWSSPCAALACLSRGAVAAVGVFCVGWRAARCQAVACWRCQGRRCDVPRGRDVVARRCGASVAGLLPWRLRLRVRRRAGARRGGAAFIRTRDSGCAGRSARIGHRGRAARHGAAVATTDRLRFRRVHARKAWPCARLRALARIACGILR